ncbi:unnamed protein product [Kluyveromyces dobzhanskii CBS 2104]|uniref:WGS project CCBQ000000000 data, contig 00008 n=1 Tax=Kluyveromyces dobzhanskii CBS 2104 TaxID=1427455 RepID=A0A0A8L9U9_9SACH|nr:unnamed protein product [Kluyveromyces dobzhanskii CBS 2104]
MSNDDGSALENRKRKWKQNVPSVNNVSSSLFDDLQILINGIDLLNVGVSNNYRPVAEFFQKGLAVQCTQGWSYYAQVNEHAKFAETTVKLRKLIAVLNSDASVVQYGIVIIRDILNNYCKVLYRGINNLRPSITNSVFSLMTEIVQFNNGQFVDEFMSYFDLTLTGLLKVLNPRKLDNVDVETTKKSTHVSMRASFIKFWIALIRSAPALLRKDILTDNQKIITAWIKNIAKMDSAETVEESLRLFNECILKEPSFKKMTKCKILNEFVVSRLHEFYYSPNKAIVSLVDEFFQIYGGDTELGIVFPERASWFEDSLDTKPGVSVFINQKEFKLHNKLLYTTLTFFKPWEDDTQCNTVMKILENVPELVAPYSTYISSMGSHDPKMTGYWFGMTLFLGRLINLPIPEYLHTVETDSLPSTAIVMESIIPCSLTKTALTKCFQNNVNLIRQMGSQLLVFSLRKLDKVLDLYNEKGWDTSKSMLLNAYFLCLPDLPTFTATLNTLYTDCPSNKILPLSLTVILNYYSKIFPNFFNVNLPASNIYVDIMKSEQYSGIDLVMLDNFMKFQELNNSQIKWWNASNNENSLFTSLLRLASSKNSSSIVISRISNLLHSLLQFTNIFKMEELTSSPLSALINSLSVLTNADAPVLTTEGVKIWKLFDEVISRCYKTPYKYVDLARQYENHSPFLMALIEQWKFVEIGNPKESVIVKWLLVFFRNMLVLGESENGIRSLLSSFENIPKDLVDFYLSFDDDSIKNLSKPELLLVQNDSTSTYDHILLKTTAKLNNVNRFPVNSFDVAAIVFRLKKIITAGFFSPQIREIVDNLLSRVGNYALGDLTFKKHLVSKSYFSHLFDTDLPTLGSESFDLLFYVVNGIQQIYGQLDIKYDEFRDYAFGKFISLSVLENSQQRTTALSILSQIVSDKNIISCLESLDNYSDIVSYQLLQRCLVDEIRIDFDLFLKVVENADTEVQKLLEQILNAKLVNNIDASKLALAIIGKEPFFIEACMQIKTLADRLAKLYSKIGDSTTKIVIATHLNRESNEDLIITALNTSMKSLNTASRYELSAILSLFSAHHTLLDNEKTEFAVKFITERSDIKYTSEGASFIMAVNQYDNLSVKTWLNKLFLYITKNLAEKAILSDGLQKLLETIKTSMIKSSTNLSEVVKPSILNAQLEVISSSDWVQDKVLLEHYNLLLLEADQSSIQSNQMLQLLLSNEALVYSNGKGSNYNHFLTISILHQLFFMDVNANATVVLQNKLLEFYNGSVSISDSLLLSMLEKIESILGQSWTNEVISWEFVDALQETELDLIGPIKLIAKEKEGFVVTISMGGISDTLNNFPSHRPKPDSIHLGTTETKWKNLQRLYKSDDSSSDKNCPVVYDPIFVMLSVLNSEEFVRKSLADDSSKFLYNVKKFVDYRILQIAVASLSLDADTVFIAKSVLEGLLYSIQESTQFKDRRIYEVLITKILYTLRKVSLESEDKHFDSIPPIVWIGVSRICDILNQPSFELYEKSYRWVLSSPFIKNNELPLLQSVFFNDNDSFNDSENFYKYLSWILLVINVGLKVPADVSLLRKNNCFEWLMNLQNSPYLHIRLKTLLQEIMYRIQSIEGGESLLISGYASVAFSDCERNNLSKNLTASEQIWLKNKKNTKSFRNMLLNKQQLMNNLELSTRRTIIANADERIAEWMDHDELNYAKRICK